MCDKMEADTEVRPPATNPPLAVSPTSDPTSLSSPPSDTSPSESEDDNDQGGMVLAYSVSDMLDELSDDNSSAPIDSLSEVIPASDQWQDVVHKGSDTLDRPPQSHDDLSHDKTSPSPVGYVNTKVDELEAQIPPNHAYYNVADAESSDKTRVMCDIAGRQHVVSGAAHKNTDENHVRQNSKESLPSSWPQDKRGTVSSHSYEAIYDDVSGERGFTPASAIGWSSPGCSSRPVFTNTSISASAFVDSILAHVNNHVCCNSVCCGYSNACLCHPSPDGMHGIDGSFTTAGKPGNPFKLNENLNDLLLPTSAGDLIPSQQIGSNYGLALALEEYSNETDRSHDQQLQFPSVAERVAEYSLAGDIQDWDDEVYTVAFGGNRPGFVDVALDNSKYEEGKALENGTYESLHVRRISNNLGDTSSDGWGSSEFETYDESEDSSSSAVKSTKTDKLPTLPPRNTSKEAYHKSSDLPSPFQQSSKNVLDKLAAKIGQRLSVSLDNEEEDTDSPVMEINLDWTKHPPPQLPPPPPDLPPSETKRRLIVSTIVESENSYIASLRSIIEEYEQPLLQMRPSIISHDSIRRIFYKMRKILQCHHIFSIELSEAIRLWDDQQAIGNAFTASFSKSIVFDVYSAFLVNFSVAMETVKKQARSKPAFAEFLKDKVVRSANKLSLFGLMVKPVQRFPQFIMLLQDLLKSTHKDHRDRLPLQIALSELESMTHKLNDTKRESESHHDARKLISHLHGRHSLKRDKQRYLIRQDDFSHVAIVNGEQRVKTRRLFLLSDQLLCTSATQKDGEVGEKIKFKWSVPIKDVDVINTSINSAYKVQVSQGKTSVQPLKPGGVKLDSASDDNPHKRELDDLMHDLPLLESLANLSTQLRLKYEGMSADHILGLMKSVQLMIQQKSDVDRAIIRLSLPAKATNNPSERVKKKVGKHISASYSLKRGNNRSVYVFQVQSEATKQDWLLELHNAKLATDVNNKPGWYMPENQQLLSSKLPLFIKPFLLDITKQETKVRAAIPVMLPSPNNLDHGTQHLWVCSGEQGRGQVTIVSLHTNQPHVLESFSVGKSVILHAEAVPGHPRAIPHEWAFSENTVWMATENNKILIYDVLQEDREAARLELQTDVPVTCMHYLENRCYLGLTNGMLLIYHRHSDGVWSLSDPSRVQLETEGSWPVACLLPIQSTMWVGCGDSVTAVSHLCLYSPRNTHQQMQKVSHSVVLSPSEGQVCCMAMAGVGLVISFTGKSVVRLYHLESFQHLQDINIASAVTSMLQGKLKTSNETEPLMITCMLSSKGQLWLGTSTGHVLTLPLPQLEGVPQIKGRPTVAYHAHTGPVKFLSAIQCGPGSIAPKVVSESCTQSLCSFDTTRPETNSIYSRDNDFIAASSTDDRFSLSADQASMVPNDTLTSLARARWISTPDLRFPHDSVEQLYGCLMQGLDDDIEQELLSTNRKRFRTKALQLPSVAGKTSKVSGTVMEKITSSSSQHPQPRFSTLPTLREDCVQRPPAAMRQQASFDSATDSQVDMETASPDPSPYTSLDTSSTQSDIHKTLIPSYPTMVMSHHAHSRRATVVASGGEGHINWGASSTDDKRYEDICLLLWQCQL